MYSTLPSPSRLPRSIFTSLTGYSGLSQFLLGALADEDSQQLSESMQHLAMQAEAVVAGLRLDRRREHAAPLLMDTLTVLREHHTLVVRLGLDWPGLYEYRAYIAALNSFRVQIGHWLLHIDPWEDELQVTADDFALVAWRTLGEGMLLADMYEQCRQREQGADSAAPQPPTGAPASLTGGDTEIDGDAPPALPWWKLRR